MVRASRMEVARRHSEDNLHYMEKTIGAKCIRQSYDVDTENDFFIHTFIFDRVLIED